eukprot:superscaffoldBa00005309_g20177
MSKEERNSGKTASKTASKEPANLQHSSHRPASLQPTHRTAGNQPACSLPVQSRLQPQTLTWAPAWLWEAIGASIKTLVIEADDNTALWVTVPPCLSDPELQPSVPAGVEPPESAAFPVASPSRPAASPVALPQESAAVSPVALPPEGPSLRCQPPEGLSACSPTTRAASHV